MPCRNVYTKPHEGIVFLLHLNTLSHTMKPLPKINLVLIIALLFTGLSSCKKEDQTSTLVVKVVRASGSPLSGARVKITSKQAQTSGKGEMADYLPKTALTDGAGLSTFTFKYPAILDVEVTHVSFPVPTEDLIKLEPGETVQKVITVQ